MISKKKLLAIGLVIILATVGIVYALSIWSNTETITPQPALVTLSLTVNATAPYVGETVLVTTRLSNSASGVVVNLFVNSTFRAGNTTINGEATFLLPIANLDVLKVNATCTV